MTMRDAIVNDPYALAREIHHDVMAGEQEIGDAITTAIKFATARLRQELAQALDEIERLRRALEPFATIPPGGRGADERLRVTSAGDGPYHFFESDLIRAKATIKE
jgi:hypothetical protein